MNPARFIFFIDGFIVVMLIPGEEGILNNGNVVVTTPNRTSLSAPTEGSGNRSQKKPGKYQQCMPGLFC